jgi:hypothetical protein
MLTTSTPRRLKTTEIAAARQQLATQQQGRCAICQLPLHHDVLDHDHSTGAVRATLHSGCNALLGKIENNYKRYGVANLSAFLNGVAGYLQRHTMNQTGWLHSTHRTDDEKRVARNTKARRTRATKKEAVT